MQHDLGDAASFFFKTHFDMLINSAGYVAKIEMTDNSLIIDIVESEETTCLSSRASLSA